MAEFAHYHMSYRSKKKDKKLLDLFQVCPSSLTIDDEDIVRGGYGFMVKGTYEKRPVVIEKIRKRAVVSPFAVEDWWVSFAKEAETLKSINHPHIITYFGVFYNPDMQEPILVRELMSMNLREYLVKNRHVLETLKQIHLCLQIALGLQFLHHMTPPLVHGNINDKNVLVDDNGLVKIGGLDQSKHIINKDYEQRDSDFYTQVSSRFHFMEPVTTSREVSDKAQYMKTAVDIFALGALGTQIAIRSHHFLGIHGFGLLPKLHIRDEALSLSEVHPLRPLFLKCLENTGEKRPHIEQIVDELVCLMAPDYMDSKVQGVVDKIKAENKALTLENMKLENERETLCKHLTSAELSESSLSTQLTEAQEMLKTMKEERNAYQEERKAQEARHAQLEEEMKLLSCDLNKTKNSLIKKIGECVDLTAKYYEAEEYAGLFKKRIEDMQQSEISGDVDNVCVVEAEDLGPLAHEVELEKLCWIPFGIHTLTIGEQGGLFTLQPLTKDGYGDNEVITLEVPEGVINPAVCDKLCIRYGVIVYGPFDLPEGYQLGSMAVYIYFNPDHVVKPVVLKLPHWAGKNGKSSLKCVVAPHRLEEGEEKYKFKVVEEGDFRSREGCGLITIDGHCTNFSIAFKEGAGPDYYATSLSCMFEKELKAIVKIAVTYSSSVWIEIFKKYSKVFKVDINQVFSFECEVNGVKIKHNESKGRGWETCASGQLLPKDILYETHKIRSPKQLKQAVINGVYPPCLTCMVTFTPEAKESGRRTQVKVYLEGTDRSTDSMVFTCPAYEEKSLKRDAPIGRSTSPQQLSIQLTHTTGSPPAMSPHNHKQGDRNEDPPSSPVDSDEAFHTPPSHSPTEEHHLIVNGHFTGGPTSDGGVKGIPSDTGIGGIVEVIRKWDTLVVSLGVPLPQVQEFRKDETLGGYRALQYWRDGRCLREFPNTWEFFLKCVDKTCGSLVADKLKKQALEDPTWTASL